MIVNLVFLFLIYMAITFKTIVVFIIFINILGFFSVSVSAYLLPFWRDKVLERPWNNDLMTELITIGSVKHKTIYLSYTCTTECREASPPPPPPPLSSLCQPSQHLPDHPSLCRISFINIFNAIIFLKNYFLGRK